MIYVGKNKLENSTIIKRSALPLTSLKSPTSSWLAWHGGQCHVPEGYDPNEIPPQGHPGDQYICPTQLRPGTWVDEWMGIFYIHRTFLKEEFKWFPIFGKAGRVKKAPYFTQPFSTTWSPDAWAVEGAVWFTGNKPCEGEVAGPLCWLTLHVAGWQSHTFRYSRSKTATRDFNMLHTSEIITNQWNKPPSDLLSVPFSFPGISADVLWLLYRSCQLLWQHIGLDRPRRDWRGGTHCSCGSHQAELEVHLKVATTLGQMSSYDGWFKSVCVCDSGI